jgi:hypothetical protein
MSLTFVRSFKLQAAVVQQVVMGKMLFLAEIPKVRVNVVLDEMAGRVVRTMDNGVRRRVVSGPPMRLKVTRLTTAALRRLASGAVRLRSLIQ